MSTVARQTDNLNLPAQDAEIALRLLDNVPIPLVLLGKDGTIQFLNKAMESLSGRSLAEVRETCFVSTFVAERDQAREKEIIEGLFWLQEPATHRCAIVAKGGCEIIKNWTAICFSDSLGRTSAIGLVERRDPAAPDAVESSEERLLREDLRTTKESLDTLLSHSPDGILIVNAATDEMLDANDQACNMLRAQKNSLLGSKSSEVFSPEWQSDYKNSVQTKLLKNGDYFQMSALVARPEGQRLPVDVLAALAETNGTRRVHVFLRDVSKERRVQGQLRSQASLLQNVNDAIISVDMNDTILFLNKKAESVYGLNAEDAICRPLYDVIRYEFLSITHEEEHRRAIRENGFWRGEVVHYHKDGHAISVDTSVSVVSDDEGKPAGLVMVNRDITGRKEAERKLKRRGDEMAALYEIGQAISAHLNLKDALSVIHAQVGRLMRARNFYIALYDAANDEIHFPIYIDELTQKGGTSRKAGKGYTEYVIQTGRPLLLGKETEEQMGRDGYEGIGPQALSWLGVPLRLGQKVIGMMAVQSYAKADLYTDDDVRILSAISDQAAIAIENAKMFEQVRVSEETYRNLIESMSEGYVVLQDERIVFANRAFAELSSYGKEELTSRKFSELIHSTSHAVMDELYQGKLTKPEEEVLSELTLVSRDGNQFKLGFTFKNLTHNGAPALVGICPKR
ncbi:MAG: PAS domain S-box protein [Candidatus Eisenbacteria bacterium]|nr:PAS domain S-box protein [Candidatus Eisenbacteria bacterium]